MSSALHEVSVSTPLEQYESTREVRGRNRHVARKLSRLALSAVTTLSVLGIGSHDSTPDHSDYTAPSSAQQNQLIANLGEQHDITLPAYDGPFEADDLDYSFALEDHYVGESARQYGLTVPEYRVKFLDLRYDLADMAEYQTTGRDYLERVNEHLSAYGLSIDIAPTNAEVGTPLTDDEIDSNQFKQFLWDVLEVYGAMPIEFVQKIGLQRIVYQHNSQLAGEAIAGYAAAPDTIYIDYNSGHHVLLHETSHIMSYALQGSQYEYYLKPQLQSLNPTGIYDDPARNIVDTDTEVRSQLLSAYEWVNSAEYHQLLRDLHDAILRGDEAAASRLSQQRIETGSRVVTTRAHGFSNPEEDLAEVFTDIFNVVMRKGASEYMFTDEFPVVLDKTLLGLSYLEAIDRNSAHWLMSTLGAPSTVADAYWATPENRAQRRWDALRIG